MATGNSTTEPNPVKPKRDIRTMPFAPIPRELLYDRRLWPVDILIANLLARRFYHPTSGAGLHGFIFDADVASEAGITEAAIVESLDRLAAARWLRHSLHRNERLVGFSWRICGDTLVDMRHHMFLEPDDPRAMPYSDYLKTPEWAERRELALERSGHRCQVCSAEETLNVHHRTYERLGQELASDLTALCQSCHAIFHENGRLAKPSR